MNVLLVEDFDDLRSATRDLLEGFGHRVASAASAEEAQVLLTEAEAPFDAVVTDVHLPGKSGALLLEELVAQPGRPALVAYSSGLTDSRLVSLIERGQVRFLLKPFSPEDLDQALEATSQPPAPPLAGPRRLTAEPQGPRRQPAAPRGFWGLAAGLALAAGLCLLAPLLGGRAPALPDSPPPAAARRGLALETSSPQGELVETPREFSWLAVEGAAQYHLRLWAIDGTVLWETSTRDAAVALPAIVATRLDRAVVYYWQVEALTTNEAVVATSPQVRFLVRPAARAAGLA